jgi:hypothetical protein
MCMPDHCYGTNYGTERSASPARNRIYRSLWRLDRRARTFLKTYLVSNNLREFSRVLRLRLDDWTLANSQP